MTTRVDKWQLVTIVVLMWSLVSTEPALAAPPADGALVVGDFYTIRVERHGARKQFQGDLVKLNDRWLVLRHVSAGNDHGVTPMAKLPLVGRWFRSAITSPADDYLWIPRDAAVVESHGAAKGYPGGGPLGEQPAEQVSCTIEFAKGERIEKREGGMESVGDDGLTITVPKKVSVEAPLAGFGLATLAGGTISRTRMETRYSRQLISQADVLCVRVGNFNPAVLAAGSR
jgi:hypothetical protein